MKVPDSVIRVKDLDLIEHMDNVQVILNNGLYETRIFSEVPNWSANEGESAIYATGTARDLYFMINATWCKIGFNSLGSLVLFDSDGDTGITPEATADEDIIRFYTSGIYNYAMGTAGFALATGQPVLFDGITGDTKISYSSSDQYLKFTTDGVLRQEM